jgi:hypothetical protein
MPRRIEDVETEITAAVAPTRYLIALAKIFLRARASARQDQNGIDVRPLLAEFANEQGAHLPETVWVADDAPTDDLAAATARHLSAVISAAQALLELTQTGEFVPLGNYEARQHHVNYSSAYHGGGTSGGWRFESLSYAAPPRVLVPAYWTKLHTDPVTDPDIYALEAGLAIADPEVNESAREAVSCLRAELYMAAVVMLGKVMEGAWIELGITLADRAPDTNRGDALRARLMADDEGIASKIAAVRETYARSDWYRALWRKCDIRPPVLDSVVVWSDVLREARNGIHFGVRPSFANAPEKVGILFLDGAQNLRRIYAIVEAARGGF